MGPLQEILLVRQELETILNDRVSPTVAESITAKANMLVAKNASDLDSDLLGRVRDLVVRVNAKIQKIRTESEASDRAERIALARSPWVAAAEVSSHIFWNVRPLEGNDAELAELWAAPPCTEYRRSAMHSARQAELAALNLYQQLFGEAVDLSSQQLIAQNNGLWKRADIRCHQRHIDVKNARRSFSSQCAYSELCVPEYKLDRSGREVVVSGYLSPQHRQ